MPEKSLQKPEAMQDTVEAVELGLGREIWNNYQRILLLNNQPIQVLLNLEIGYSIAFSKVYLSAYTGQMTRWYVLQMWKTTVLFNKILHLPLVELDLMEC